MHDIGMNKIIVEKKKIYHKCRRKGTRVKTPLCKSETGSSCYSQHSKIIHKY